MPNVKIYIDETLLPGCRDRLVAALEPMRTLLCEGLNVDLSACQFAVLPVLALPDQPHINVELNILPHPDRTRARLKDLAEQVQILLRAATDTHAAIRIATLAPETYLAVK
jgi:hypothetical protein